MKQEYPGRADEELHFRWAQKAFDDPRYVRVDGKPMFVIFAPQDMPSTASFIDHWRELAAQAGYPGIYFVAISHQFAPGVDRYHDAILTPFDAVTLLAPQDFLQTIAKTTKRTDLRRRLKELNFGRKLNALKPKSWKRPTRVQYKDVVAHAMEDMPSGERFLPCVLPGWDNTPRSSHRGVVYEGETPELFRTMLEKAVDRVSGHSKERRIVFLKAWNEWAEGNYVEPDALSGHAYLDAIRSVILPGSSQ
jgi:hypothetical protein